MGNITIDTPTVANWPTDIRMTPDAAEKLFEAVNLTGMGVGATDRWAKIAKKSMTGAAIHAGVQAWQNPESVPIYVYRVEAYRSTKSTGASTMDIGTTATSATTASDNLIDGVNSGATEDVEDNLKNPGTNGKAGQLLAAGKWVTFKEASGDTTGLVLDAYIHYHLLG